MTTMGANKENLGYISITLKIILPLIRMQMSVPPAAHRSMQQFIPSVVHIHSNLFLWYSHISKKY